MADAWITPQNLIPGLEAIGEAYLAKDFIDAAKRIVSEIVPTICGTSDALFGSGLTPQMWKEKKENGKEMGKETEKKWKRTETTI